MKLNVTPNNTQKKLGEHDFIVSKTDTSGRITYANRIFMDIAGLPESELLGVQHNVIRHPDMPRGVFRFMWNTLKAVLGSNYSRTGKKHNILYFFVNLSTICCMSEWLEPSTLKAGDEFIGFAKNLCADGGYYWVFANITPDYDKDGKLQGYYSVRRQPPQSALDVLIPVYKEMLAIEKSSSAKDAPEKSLAYLFDVVDQAGVKNYDRLILGLYKPNGV